MIEAQTLSTTTLTRVALALHFAETMRPKSEI